jgi:hypothetical protein
MDIKDILDSLGIDLTNQEAKRGAIEAIQAILASRTPPPDIGGGGGGITPPEKEIDVEIDPDLIQPSQKFNQPGSDEDIEIEDEEDILSQVKQNKSEDDIETEGEGSSEDSSSTDSDDNSSDDASSETSGNANDSTDSAESQEEADDTAEIADEGDEGAPEASNGASEDEAAEDEEDVLDSSEDDEFDSEDEDSYSEDEEDSDDEDDEVSSDEDEKEFEDAEFDEEESKEEDSEEEDSDEYDFDEDDLLDDEIKNSYDDQEIKSKREARRIKRERTLSAAKTALDKAKARNVSQALIRELEKAIEALESLTEAKAKSLADISDEEFNLMVNRVFDAISAVGDNDLTFTSDEDRKLKAQEIKTDLESRETQQALSDEDIAAIRAETQAVKAREKEAAIYKTPSKNSFKGFQEFLNSLYRAVALQVQTNEVQDDTWSAINRRYSGTGVLKQGQRKNDLPDRKIPIIDFYFDCSGSWGADDIEVGKKAVSALVDMEEKGQIKINIYYFSNHVFNDMQSALDEGGTQAWNDIVKNVITTQATNVVIMTDSDMEDWWEGHNSGKPALKYTVPGYVWYLWRDGSNAPRLPRDLKGRGGVQQFSFSRGDV